MKVRDILLEDAPRGPRSEWASRYKLSYNQDSKQIVGGMVRWLEAIGATAEDVDEAFKKAKQLPSYKALTVISTDVTGPKRKRTGVFAFEPDAESNKGKTNVFNHAKGPKIYVVLPNGQIRYDEKDRGEGIGASKGKLASPKPRVRPGDPVKSIVMMYDNAFQLLEKKIAKQLKEGVESHIDPDRESRKFAKSCFNSLEKACDVVLKSGFKPKWENSSGAGSIKDMFTVGKYKHGNDKLQADFVKVKTAIAQALGKPEEGKVDNEKSAHWKCRGTDRQINANTGSDGSMNSINVWIH